MPCYTFLSSLYRNFSDLDSDDHEYFWDWIRSKLASEKPFYLPSITYLLWCNFFENNDRVEDAWYQLAQINLPNPVLQNVLIYSGPVPFHLKLELYHKLISDSSWHYFIFKSILHSAFDVYGQINYKEARYILSQLHLDPKTEYYNHLLDKLS